MKGEKPVVNEVKRLIETFVYQKNIQSRTVFYSVETSWNNNVDAIPSHEPKSLENI